MVRKSEGKGRKQPAAVKPAPAAEANPYVIPPNEAALLESPLDYIFADHFRVRVVCNMLDMLADDIVGEGRRLAPLLVRFLREDFMNHLEDEEQGLMPLLHKRLLVGDEVDEALGQVTSEHEADRQITARLVARLDELVERGAVAEPGVLAEAARAFAEFQRRHIVWENVVLLPIARLRLTRSDLRQLAADMTRRRARLKAV